MRSTEVSRSGGGGEIKRKRDVLGDVADGAGHVVLLDEETDLVALFSGGFAGGESFVDLLPQFEANRLTVDKAVIVAAGVKRGGHGEDGLRGGQRDRRAIRVDERWGFFVLVNRASRRRCRSSGSVGSSGRIGRAGRGAGLRVKRHSDGE